MNLGTVAYIDCLIFCLFLAPTLVWKAGLFETVWCALQALPFLLLKLPIVIIWDRVLSPFQRPFSQRVTLFEDVVVRCMRYAFANVPPRIGRVFFAREVALPYLWFRLLRKGHFGSPIYWREHGDTGFRGIWVRKDPVKKPDLVLYYLHGGGFSMGSAHFYLEYLLTWLGLLSLAGYQNPAIFALEYTLVPDAPFPTQVKETWKGYEHVLDVTHNDPSIVCVSGDSAGATLVLCLLLCLMNKRLAVPTIYGREEFDRWLPPTPALAVLISPWTTLVSTRHRNTVSDYLDAQKLCQYGVQFAGSYASAANPLASPGCCRDASWWKRASPKRGFVVTYGTEEVLAPAIEDFVDTLREAEIAVESRAEPGGIHAWPVASLFLSSSHEGRLDELKALTYKIRQRIPGP
ncbi:monoterpene epsilon-lactone hydrolase [Dichotomopilus funicola]|uniref:Monoterpene epsilon-lactone hydrolase n=1 Tax=Dichotomopilus funicola TaxID=1934379 RepID=A0AAN6V2Z1_9PEZI|nr:monoterpene epsilon-lactone hydrolase [Dichotomopilus funicola]